LPSPSDQMDPADPLDADPPDAVRCHWPIGHWHFGMSGDNESVGQLFKRASGDSLLSSVDECIGSGSSLCGVNLCGGKGVSSYRRAQLMCTCNLYLDCQRESTRTITWIGKKLL
jgi:hypothetical protein